MFSYKLLKKLNKLSLSIFSISSIKPSSLVLVNMPECDSWFLTDAGKSNRCHKQGVVPDLGRACDPKSGLVQAPQPKLSPPQHQLRPPQPELSTNSA